METMTRRQFLPMATAAAGCIAGLALMPSPANASLLEGKLQGAFGGLKGESAEAAEEPVPSAYPFLDSMTEDELWLLRDEIDRRLGLAQETEVTDGLAPGTPVLISLDGGDLEVTVERAVVNQGIRENALLVDYIISSQNFVHLLFTVRSVSYPHDSRADDFKLSRLFALRDSTGVSLYDTESDIYGFPGYKPLSLAKFAYSQDTAVQIGETVRFSVAYPVDASETELLVVFATGQQMSVPIEYID